MKKTEEPAQQKPRLFPSTAIAFFLASATVIGLFGEWALRLSSGDEEVRRLAEQAEALSMRIGHAFDDAELAADDLDRGLSERSGDGRAMDALVMLLKRHTGLAGAAIYAPDGRRLDGRRRLPDGWVVEGGLVKRDLAWIGRETVIGPPDTADGEKGQIVPVGRKASGTLNALVMTVDVGAVLDTFERESRASARVTQSATVYALHDRPESDRGCWRSGDGRVLTCRTPSRRHGFIAEATRTASVDITPPFGSVMSAVQTSGAFMLTLLFAATALDIIVRRRQIGQLETSQVQAAHESEHRLRSVMEGSSEGVCIHVDGRVVFINKAFATMLGVQDPHNMLGKSLRALVAPVSRSVLDDLLDAQRRGEPTDRSVDVDFLNQFPEDGAPAVVNTVCSVVRITWEGEEAIMLSAVNISNRRAMEVELRAAKEQAEAALAKERQFVSTASHEFRTPLTIIDGAAQALARHKTVTPEELNRRIETIRGAVKRMTGLIESTLSAARLDAGKIVFSPETVRLHTLVSEVTARHQGISQRHTLAVDIADMPETIVADSRMLDQIFSNLISNAIKYSRSSPQIEIRGWEENATACLSVTDHGVGIPDDEIPMLFSRFFRASTSTGIPGTGIGLHLIREFVDLHGGSIAVRSAVGRGTTFTVRLPKTPPARPTETHDTDTEGATHD